MSKPILCLDFDGVLHGYQSGWRGARTVPDPPVPGAMKFLIDALDHFEVAIHSSRSRYFGGRGAMKAWLRHHLCEHFWAGGGTDVSNLYASADYDEHYLLKADLIVKRISFPLWKPPAHVTLDDRAVTFEGAWPAMEHLKNFKPWNRRENG